MQSSTLIKMAKASTWVTFGLGTLIMVLFYFTMKNSCLLTGLYFTFLSLLVNLALLIRILIQKENETSIRKQLTKSGLWMLINIPVFIGYCYFAIVLLNTLRITFTNPTSIEISNIKINGCEVHEIVNLSPHASQTVWIGIHNECQIDIVYETGGITKSETVSQYVTPLMGGIGTHKIDGKNKELFL